MIRTLSSWLSHPVVAWGLGLFSVFAVLASIVLVPRFLAALPTDYLRSDAASAHVAMPLRILRNLLGVVLVLLGLLMLVLPGQGLLTLLVGVLLVDFPRKQRLIRRVLGRPRVLGLVNKLRSHRGSPPLLT